MLTTPFSNRISHSQIRGQGQWNDPNPAAIPRQARIPPDLQHSNSNTSLPWSQGCSLVNGSLRFDLDRDSSCGPVVYTWLGSEGKKRLGRQQNGQRQSNPESMVQPAYLVLQFQLMVLYETNLRCMLFDCLKEGEAGASSTYVMIPTGSLAQLGVRGKSRVNEFDRDA